MRWRPLPTILMLLCLLPGTGAQALAAEKPLRVVVVQSYHPEFIWVQNINQGIRDALQGLKVELDYYYLDGKRHPDPQRLREISLAVVQEIERLNPQVVITVDDMAQEYLAAPHLKGRAAPQVVFCGVNAAPGRYGFPAANVSGVRERWHFREGFALLKKIDPRLRSVAVLVDDSESGGFVLDELREDQKRHGAFALKLGGVEKIHTFQEWQEKVLAYNKRGDALALGLYHSLVDADTGQVVPAEEVSAWNKRVVTRPTLGFMDFSRDHGILCGVLEAGHEQGLLAGQMARSVLERGVKAGSLPVRLNQRGVILVNIRAAERLGLTIPFDIIRAAAVVVP